MGVRTRRTAVAAAFLCVAVLLALGGTGYAKSDPAKKSVSVFYGASRWLPTNSETRWGGQIIGSLDCLGSAHAEGADMFRIPLDLPNGAAIEKITFHYFDTDPGARLHFWLSQHIAGVEDVVEGFPEVFSADQPPLSDPDASPAETVRSVDAVPESPVALDTTETSYMLSVGFSRCGTFTPMDPAETTFILADGVRVQYALK